VTYGELIAFVATAIAYWCSLRLVNRLSDENVDRRLWALPAIILFAVLVAWAALLAVRTFGIPY